MSGCNHDCEHCNESCNERENGCNHDCEHCEQNCESKIVKLQTNQYSDIDKTIGIVSGKGGVGKSVVTSLLTSASSKLGYKSAILDGDILGPSICKMFGVKDKAYGDPSGKFIMPARTNNLDIDVISTAMILDNDTDPVIWRGSLVSSIVSQFYTDVVYGHQDVLFIDMPPGTGDVPLTIFQSIPLDGIVIITSPQDLVSMIVEKALNMANMMNIPVIGLVENYSYITCPDCGKKIELFGKSNAEELAKKYNIPYFISLPLDPQVASLCDKGEITKYETNKFDELIKYIFEK